MSARKNIPKKKKRSQRKAVVSKKRSSQKKKTSKEKKLRLQNLAKGSPKRGKTSSIPDTYQSGSGWEELFSGLAAYALQ